MSIRVTNKQELKTNSTNSANQVTTNGKLTKGQEVSKNITNAVQPTTSKIESTIQKVVKSEEQLKHELLVKERYNNLVAKYSVEVVVSACKDMGFKKVTDFYEGNHLAKLEKYIALAIEDYLVIQNLSASVFKQAVNSLGNEIHFLATPSNDKYLSGADLKKLTDKCKEIYSEQGMTRGVPTGGKDSLSFSKK